jgi:hypothetical protein
VVQATESNLGDSRTRLWADGPLEVIEEKDVEWDSDLEKMKKRMADAIFANESINKRFRISTKVRDN